jgi:peptide deformylase
VSLRRIRVFGDPVLRATARPVEEFGSSIRRLVADLSETLATEGGAGLAAPQIGVGLRAFVFLAPYPSDNHRICIRHLVNPVLVHQSDDGVDDLEGCLSVPGLEYSLERPRRIVAAGFDQHGEPVTIDGTERLARCLAHETDHLDGVLFIDRLDPETRKRAKAEIRERLLAGEELIVKRSPH